jgi:hypothetical protein
VEPAIKSTGPVFIFSFSLLLRLLQRSLSDVRRTFACFPSFYFAFPLSKVRIVATVVKCKSRSKRNLPDELG